MCNCEATSLVLPAGQGTVYFIIIIIIIIIIVIIIFIIIIIIIIFLLLYFFVCTDNRISYNGRRCGQAQTSTRI